MATQSAATYIVTMDYVAHYILDGYFNVGGTKEDPIPYVIKFTETAP